MRYPLAIACVLLSCGQKKPAPATEPPAKAPDAVTTTSSRAATGNAGGTNAPPVTSAGASSGTASTEELGLGAAVVHFPGGLGTNKKAPLVVVLHGYGASSDAISKYSDFVTFAEAKHIAWVAPDGKKDKNGKRFWNAGSSCCNFDHDTIDHVTALRKLITRAIDSYPIDAKRVYVVGYSNGGFMAHRIACDLGGVVAGVVSVSGAGVNADEACPAKVPVRVLQIHGDADPVVSIGGGVLFGDPRYPTHVSAKQTVGDWGKRFGCKPKPKAEKPFDFEAKLPGAETTAERFEDCRPGSAVELWTIAGGNHFVGFHSPSQEAIWKFLSGS